jgi:homospermidine synthase
VITFKGRIVQFGFGAVGKSFYENIAKEICFDEYKYFVITRNKDEYEAYINLGGIASNFIVAEITRENYQSVFSQYLGKGDLLVDFADSVGTKDFCEWCAENNIMYINTGETDWPDHWYSIFSENEKKAALKNVYNKQKDKNLYPIVLQHGNNPGLVSHFVKAGISYIINSQFKKDKRLKHLLKENRYNEAARLLGVKMIHVNDADLQEVKGDYKEDVLISPWCIDSFWFEMLSEATFNVGTHEQIDYKEESNLYDSKKGYFEFKQLAADKKCHTYYPGGAFDGFMVPHEETITIAKSLEVKEGDKVIYRPSVMFLYSPCKYARDYLEKAKVNEYPNPDLDKPMDCENVDGKSIIRGRVYPKNWEILYPEKIESGTEYVGVLILGDRFKPVWVGNRIERTFLEKDKKKSFWQTPTITPVAMSALACVCWMLKNKDKGGIYFPDDIMDYQYILKIAEKYISKTIYQTFTKEEIENSLQVNLSNPQTKQFIIKREV